MPRENAQEISKGITQEELRQRGADMQSRRLCGEGVKQCHD